MEEGTMEVLELTKIGDVIFFHLGQELKGHYVISTTCITLLEFPRERLDELWNKIQELK